MHRQESKAAVRSIALEKKTRFHRQKIMFFRSNLLLHTQRVGYHLEALLPLAQEVYGAGINTNLARAVAQVFDDFELEVGDYDPHERANIEEEIPNAISERRHAVYSDMVRTYADLTFSGVPYVIAIGAALRRASREAQLVHYCDEFNGFGEALHEYFSGNILFEDAVQGYLVKQRNQERHPLLRDLFSHTPEAFIPPLSLPPSKEIFPRRETIVIEVGYAPYDCWKRNIICIGGEKGLASLIEQKEYLRQGRKEEGIIGLSK